jgi:hypothetical protein
MRLFKQLLRQPEQLLHLLKQLLHQPEQLLHLLKQLLRQPEQLLHLLKQLLHQPEQLLRFPKELTRFAKVSTDFPEVAMRPPKVWRMELKGGGRAWFVLAGSLLVFNLWVGWRCAQQSRPLLRLIHPGGCLRAIILLGGGCSGCAVEADWCA